MYDFIISPAKIRIFQHICKHLLRNEVNKAKKSYCNILCLLITIMFYAQDQKGRLTNLLDSLFLFKN